MLRDLNFKEFLLGKTLPTSAHAEERLSNTAALAWLRLQKSNMSPIADK